MPPTPLSISWLQSASPASSIQPPISRREFSAFTNAPESLAAPGSKAEGGDPYQNTLNEINNLFRPEDPVLTIDVPEDTVFTNAVSRVSAAETILGDASDQQTPEAEGVRTGQAEIVFKSDPVQLTRAQLDRWTEPVDPSTLPMVAGLNEGLEVPEPEEMSQTRFWCWVVVICMLPPLGLLAGIKIGALLERDPSPDLEKGGHQRARHSRFNRRIKLWPTINEEELGKELDELTKGLDQGRDGSICTRYESYMVVEGHNGVPLFNKFKSS